jgi:hypothetical protein
MRRVGESETEKESACVRVSERACVCERDRKTRVYIWKMKKIYTEILK